MSKLREQADAIDEALVTLEKLFHHHDSQAKPQTSPVRKEYNKELATMASRAYAKLRRAFQ